MLNVKCSKVPHRKKLKESIKLLVAAITALLLMGTIVFSALEGWSLVDSFYFVSMTATTVGYGDFYPTHTLSKIITVFYSLAIVPFVLYAFTVIAKFEVERVSRQISGIQRKQTEQEKEIEKTERKIQEQKRLMKEQQEILDKQESQIKKTKKELKEHDVELEGHQKELKKTKKELKEHDVELEGHQKELKKTKEELKEHDVELEVVEDVVEEEMAKKHKK